MLLDTHAILWWILDPDKLSTKAAEICNTLDRTSASLSSVSIWEIGIKIKKGKLDIGISIEDFTQRLKKLGFIRIIPVDEAIWIRNLSLEWDHTDPADRTIVATAQIENLPILTKDEAIHQFEGVKTVW